MSERTLEYEVGNLIFHWDITSQEILVYEAESHRWLAKLAVMTPDEEIVPFEQEAFEAHCDWFLAQGKPAPTPYDPWVCPETGSTDWCVQCTDADPITGHWPVRLSEYRSTLL